LPLSDRSILVPQFSLASEAAIGRWPKPVEAALPVAKWHAQIGDPTVADSILDRVVHGAHRIELQGDSIRKLKGRNGKKDE